MKRSSATPAQSKKASTSGQLEKKSQLATTIAPDASENDDDTAPNDGDKDEADTDTTLRHESGTSDELNIREVDEEDTPMLPESSDELERICESVWSLFGDNLRYVAVDREGADYQETLRVLQDLSSGKSSVGDVSMASSSSESQATAATSGSTGFSVW